MMAQAEISAFAPLAGAAMSLPWERRCERWQVWIWACCRTRAGLRHDAVITDISTGGCRIENWSTAPRIGDQVVVRPQGLEGLPGTICWVKHNAVGVQFDRPLYGPVVEHICRKHQMI